MQAVTFDQNPLVIWGAACLLDGGYRVCGPLSLLRNVIWKVGEGRYNTNMEAVGLVGP